MSKKERTLGISLAILLIFIAGYAIITKVLRQEKQSVAERLISENPPATSIWRGQTAKNAYAPAYQTAQQWATDAVLATATATWPTGSNLQTGAATWTFTFYSPTQSRTILVAVSDSRAIMVSEKANVQLSIRDNIENWQIDSRQLIQQVLAEGGQAFLDRQQSSPTLVLSLRNEAQLVWEAVLFVESSGSSFSLRVNAANGAIVP